MLSISACTFTRNDASTIGRWLDQVTDRAAEIVVLDAYSTDGTAEIIRERRLPNLRLYQEPFRGFVRTRNRFFDLATHPIILGLDVDEVLLNDFWNNLPIYREMLLRKYHSVRMRRFWCRAGHAQIVKIESEVAELTARQERERRLPQMEYYRDVLYRADCNTKSRRWQSFRGRSDLFHNLSTRRFYLAGDAIVVSVPEGHKRRCPEYRARRMLAMSKMSNGYTQSGWQEFLDLFPPEHLERMRREVANCCDSAPHEEWWEKQGRFPASEAGPRLADFDPSPPPPGNPDARIAEPQRGTTRWITAYIGERSPEIRPATRDRAWVRRKPNRFPRHCLPLMVACEMGWQLLVPTTVAARWNGGRDRDDIEFDYQSAERPDWISSTFGHGILSFAFGTLFRTSPGVNLWVKGPTNLPKRGLSPLEGFVETDWSPYSFTMNYQITEKDRWIVFRAGEPYCQILPYPRGFVQSFEPELHRREQAPELQHAHDLFTVDRRRTHRHHDLVREYDKRGQPVDFDTPSCPFHRKYLKGSDWFGNRFPEHEMVVRAKPFVFIDDFDPEVPRKVYPDPWPEQYRREAEEDERNASERASWERRIRRYRKPLRKRVRSARVPAGARKYSSRALRLRARRRTLYQR